MSILEDSLAYPSFEALTDENDPSMDYYDGWDVGCVEPSRNWCYLADHPMRPSALVRDREGKEHLIVYYLDNGDKSALTLQVPRGQNAVLYGTPKRRRLWICRDVLIAEAKRLATGIDR
jgi:hypothetical protein